MAVTLFKDGGRETFDEYSFVDRLKEGWRLTESEEDGIIEGAEELAESEDKPVDIESMNKKELEIYARGFGVELDRRMSKKNMLKDFNNKKGD